MLRSTLGVVCTCLDHSHGIGSVCGSAFVVWAPCWDGMVPALPRWVRMQQNLGVVAFRFVLFGSLICIWTGKAPCAAALRITLLLAGNAGAVRLGCPESQLRGGRGVEGWDERN